MTDSDAFHDDEVVSAYLDGEATPEERARVENDPRLQQRLAEFRQVATAVGTPHFFPEAPARDALLAQAVTQSTIAPTTREEPGSGKGIAPVIDLAARRRRTTIVLSAAAAVLVIAIAVPAALRTADSGQDDVAAIETANDQLEDRTDASPDDGASEAADDGDTGNGFEPSAPNTTTGAADTTPQSTTATGALDGPQPPVDLGMFASRADAQQQVTEEIDRALAAAPIPAAGELAVALAGEGAACAATIEAADDELVRLVYAAEFQLPDGRHQVLVYELTRAGATNGTHRVYEQLLPGCQRVGVQTI